MDYTDVETCSCPYGCGVDLEYEGCRQWVCPKCGVVLDLEGVEAPDDDED
jgi:acetone carboxylase gamma subunit